MYDIAEANRMLETFASCGAISLFVTKTELAWPGHKKMKWGNGYPLSSLRERLPSIIRTAAIRHPMTGPDGQIVMAGENVIIRPTGSVQNPITHNFLFTRLFGPGITDGQFQPLDKMSPS